ncbi:hypothetical protein B0H63DRAFT_519898 [Podospora didyma]|uniref:O-methyltransferase n=1 Tax=Podospora didyma TaxID=330526 RepID=A0AAE0NZM7_9PEZI|nr:hypothetical protein B0H63DRAFT_519898 [Podospora didyma]
MASPTEDLLAQLHTAGAALGDKRPGAREKLLSLGYAPTASLELPSEAIFRIFPFAHCYPAEVVESIKESGAHGISAQELASKPGADAVLIARILKHLTTMNIIRESGVGIYVGTLLSDALAEMKYDVAGLVFQILPAYLKPTDFALPAGLTDGPFQAAHKTELPFFPRIDHNPPCMQLFNSYMTAYRAGKPSWVDLRFYLVTERLADAFDAGANSVVLIVDDCVKILEQLKAAMTKQRRVACHDDDNVMLVLEGMRERTEDDWKRILETAGLAVVKIYSVEMGTESLIEAELA